MSALAYAYLDLLAAGALVSAVAFATIALIRLRNVVVARRRQW